MHVINYIILFALCIIGSASPPEVEYEAVAVSITDKQQTNIELCTTQCSLCIARWNGYIDLRHWLSNKLIMNIEAMYKMWLYTKIKTRL